MAEKVEDEETGEMRLRSVGAALQVRLEPEQFNQLKLSFLELLEPQLPKPVDSPLFGELISDWLEHVAKIHEHPKADERVARHLKPLFLDTEDAITADIVEAHMDRLLAGGLGAGTVNKVRGAGRLTVELAKRRGKWRGHNPFQLAKRMREKKRRYVMLSLEDLAKVQAHLRDDRRRMFRVALHLGLRTGELMALRKEDVDQDRGIIHIRRSHGREETKTGKDREVPLLPAIAGDIAEAIRLAKSQLLFGKADGTQQRADTKLTRMLRTAMAEAGVAIEFTTYKCRRSGCGFREVFESHLLDRDCHCGYRLLPVPQVAPFRWYDLRHMCATFHDRAGAKPMAVSLLLGHSIPGMTQGRYTHLRPEDMFHELNRWRLPF